MLHDAPEGMFVVRPSNIVGSYALSVVHHSTIAHMLIVNMANGRFHLGRSTDNQPTFSSVPDLVSHYIAHPFARNDVTGEEFRLLQRGLSRKTTRQSYV